MAQGPSDYIYQRSGARNFLKDIIDQITLSQLYSPGGSISLGGDFCYAYTSCFHFIFSTITFNFVPLVNFSEDIQVLQGSTLTGCPSCRPTNSIKALKPSIDLYWLSSSCR